MANEDLLSAVAENSIYLRTRFKNTPNKFMSKKRKGTIKIGNVERLLGNIVHGFRQMSNVPRSDPSH